MKKYKLIGVAKYAHDNLSGTDLEALKDMIGCEVVESERQSNVDGKLMLQMPDGVDTHIDFLQLDEIQQKIKFE